MQDFEMWSVFEDQNRIVWINISDDDLMRVKDDRLTTFPVRFPSRHLSAHEDRKGSIWLAWGDKGLGQLKDGRLTCFAPS